MPERYEDVRKTLVARGYLQGGIERFVLRDLFAGHGARALARTSGKAALLGGPLLGAVLAGSTVAGNRPLLGMRDALVLWLYFAVVAAAALFVLDLGAAGLAAAWARRRGARSSDALRAGLIVAVPVLAYLVVLWARGRPAGGFGADLLFLAAATAAAALVAWLAGLVSLAGIVGRTGEIPDRNRHFAMLALVFLLPVAAAFFVVPAATTTEGTGAVPPSIAPATAPSGRLIVLGIDGLDGALVATDSSDDALPHLLDLLARGATYPKRRAPAEPPEVWTTIATGMTSDAHGVRQAGATQLPGVAAPIAPRSAPIALHAALRFLLPTRTVPASGAGRRVRALWEIASFSRKAAVVGWWATWPASGTEGDPPVGYVVSDRVLAKLLVQRGEDRDASPASLYARLAGDFASDRTRWRAEFAERFAALSGETSAWAWESFLIDAFAWRTAQRLLDDPDVAIAFTYLPGLDILRTRLSGRADEARVLSAYLRWLDGAIFAELPSGDGERVVLIADPGRSAGHEAEGFVAIAGRGIAAACVGDPVDDLDVAPIVLRLSELPVSAEMRGVAPAACIETLPPAPAAIATWGRRGRSASNRGSDYDPEMVERLKSLGYLR